MSVIIPSDTPAGSIMLFAGPATNPAPDGWLWCDGAEYDEAAYPRLANACNNMYGAASAGKFRVPNMSGRVAIGSGNDGTTTRNPGERPGAATHTLTQAEMPTHAHSINDPGHGHTMTIYYASGPGFGATALAGASGNVTGGFPGQAINGSGTGITINNSGSNGAHNNMQPSAVVGGYIIKT